jgi:hypothetical protein
MMKRHADKTTKRSHIPAKRQTHDGVASSVRITGQTRHRSTATTKRKTSRALTEEEQQLLIEAMSYCLHHFPMLWTTGGLPEERVGKDGVRQWIIQVHLRYPTGFDGYLGDLLYDGKQFIEMTDREIMRERAQQIAADPKGIRQWNEYQASTLRTGKA